jgi:hypothetical protein
VIKVIGVFATTILLGTSLIQARELSRERQLRILQNYLMATGQTDLLTALSLSTELPDDIQLPLKCGTPAVLEFVINRHSFDADLAKVLGEQLVERPTDLNLTKYSPSGRFLIHYTSQGQDAVYNGITGYVDSVAAIFDDVYSHLVNTLGYPDPPTDGFYPEGGDDAFDVYLQDLGGLYYGLTQMEELVTSQTATAFMILDNDYQEISVYRDRPLDAVRVTCAHEFYHVIQFGIDFTEGTYTDNGPYWMEMSATWMEEEMYDHINDYYFYLPHFFEEPYTSIQRFHVDPFIPDFHPYGSVVYPLFLSQRYDRDLIRDIWLQCAHEGTDTDDFLAAADHVIDSASGGLESFASSFREFTVWNYYTGTRADLAPDDIGYEERAVYAEFLDHTGDSVIAVYANYEDSVVVNRYVNMLNPYHNAAFYLRLDELQSIKPDTTYWVCNSGSFPACSDSSQVIDPSQGYDTMYVGSTFAVGFDLDPGFPYEWGLSIIYQLADDFDSTIVELRTLPVSFSDLIEFEFAELQNYRSMAFIVTPTSADRSRFWYPEGWYDVGYQIGTAQQVIDSSLINLPAAILAPYPNPAVLSELDGGVMMFKFQVPTDSLGLPVYGERYAGSSPSLYVDIFNAAGEYIRTLDGVTNFDEREGVYWTQWDLKNSSGRQVASGVYIAYARLFADNEHTQLLVEDKAKVLVIR